MESSSSSSINGGFSQIGSVKQLTADSISQFREGIRLILSKWSALQLAVENEWGGQPLYIDDLESILDEAMLSLNTMIEDGSVEEVAEKLMIMHEECLEGNYSSIQKLRDEGPRMGAHQHVKQAVEDDDDSEDSDGDDKMGGDGSNMMVDTPEFQLKTNLVNKPVNESGAKEAQSEDGWTVVSSRRNKGKRN
ncbi:hypothetical protein D5086_024216 [Populus alba]|uniref:Uncharacterized protein n=1 Tax=Populus alba TaxID=43335 RepID=A0ACC4B6M0_POPAL